MIKRITDIMFSLTGLIILFPVFLIVAIIIKIDSRGPVFYLRERVGKKAQLKIVREDKEKQAQ